MFGDVPFGGGDGVGSGRIDENRLFGGVLAPFFKSDSWLQICTLLWWGDEYNAACYSTRTQQGLALIGEKIEYIMTTIGQTYV
jgi:hypothetical protein